MKIQSPKFSKKNFSIDENAYLVGSLKKIVSPNQGDAFDTLSPCFIILHYTATVNAEDAIEILIDEAREVSAHLVIARNGEVTQLVPFNKIAWHAGVSSWQGIESLNKCSIGIELVNAGKLEKKDESYLTWDEKEIAPSEVEEFSDSSGESSYWQNYPDAQILRLREIVALLSATYPVKDVLMHSEIAPDRKIDPGPVFPIKEFRKRILA